jgi:hypothetical protein
VAGGTAEFLELLRSLPLRRQTLVRGEPSR